MTLIATSPGDFVLSAVPYNPSDGLPESEFVVLSVGNGRGGLLFTITADGQMQFAPGVSPGVAARAFKVAMNMAARQAVFALDKI